MMSKFVLQKKSLLKKVYAKAENCTTEKSFSGILKDLENTLRDDFKIQLSYKTFETYYKSMVENNEDYNIKSSILNDLSIYLGFKNFKDFCEKIPIEELVGSKKSTVEVTISENDKKGETLSTSLSKIIINITNQPIFTLPEFITKHSNSFGLVGIILLLGLIINKKELIIENNKKEEKNITDSSAIPLKEVIISNPSTPQSIAQILQTKTVPKVPEKIIITKKEKECMYWDGKQYIPVFCDEILENYHIEQLNKDKLKMHKILSPDTLTLENAIDKVWYDKSNNKVEFFTHYGVHPTNGKTLKEVTEHILETYAHQ